MVKIDWNDSMRDQEWWEESVEGLGDLHDKNCQSMREDPDQCDCDMRGIKPEIKMLLELDKIRIVKSARDGLIHLTRFGDVRYGGSVLRGMWVNYQDVQDLLSNIVESE